MNDKRFIIGSDVDGDHLLAESVLLVAAVGETVLSAYFTFPFPLPLPHGLIACKM